MYLGDKYKYEKMNTCAEKYQLSLAIRLRNQDQFITTQSAVAHPGLQNQYGARSAPSARAPTWGFSFIFLFLVSFF
jgi:hypothetical protein